MLAVGVDQQREVACGPRAAEYRPIGVIHTLGQLLRPHSELINTLDHGQSQHRSVAHAGYYYYNYYSFILHQTVQ